jgi:hypothetical protein
MNGAGTEKTGTLGSLGYVHPWTVCVSHAESITMASIVIMNQSTLMYFQCSAVLRKFIKVLI